jgi:tousled-like kinase
MISNKVDIWSLGVIFYEILFGKQPFGLSGTQDLFLNQKIDNKWDIEIESGVCISTFAKDFIQKCLKVDVDKRLDPFSAINHPYFNSEFDLNELA